MELLNLISVLILPISLTLIIFTLVNKKKDRKRVPPGRNGWPVIGETLDLLSWARKGSPDKFFSLRTSRYNSDIFNTCLLGQQITAMSGAHANKFLFSTESQRVTPWLPSTFDKIFPSFLAEREKYSEDSILRRRLMIDFLRPDSLKAYIGAMDVIAMRHIQQIQQHASLIVYPFTKRYTFEIACKVMLSMEDEEEISKLEKHFGALLAGMVSVPINLPGLPLNRAIKAAELIRKEIREIIKKRRNEMNGGKEDLLCRLLTKPYSNGKLMEDREILDIILGALFAGHDTASIAITFTIHYMAHHPHIYHQVYLEQMEIAKRKQPGEVLTYEDLQTMSYSWNVTCEALRIFPPSLLIFRSALADLTYHGFSIPKGTKLTWSPYSTHKDAKYFPEPEKFDPTRFQGNNIQPYTFMSFGAGPRKCPGVEYARIEILVLIHNMVKTFKWQKMFPDEKIMVDPMPRFEKNLPISLHLH